MLRFVVLDHDWPQPHRDLLLERDGVLKAWRLPAHFDPTSPIPAEPNFDHQLLYLDYEGPISGNRGSVRRWDAGEVVWEAFNDDEVRVWLSGTHLRGRFRLADGGVAWVLIREPGAGGDG
ncbi:MAG: hypothetical protein MUF18_03725 [Fimbriiglobus sp.]|nr:hypothetical protein [Fimbriiglobus sp.]